MPDDCDLHPSARSGFGRSRFGCRARSLGVVGGLLILGAVLASCSSGRSASPSTTTAPTTTVVPTNSATPPGPAFPYSWDRVRSAAVDLGGGAQTTLAAVMAPKDSAGWIVVGTVTSKAGVPSATEWTSPDGLAWTRSTIPMAPATSGGSQASAVATYRNRTVVVGSIGVGAQQRAAAWVSPQPGAPLQEEPVPPAAGPSAMTAVAAGTLGMFAIGRVNGQFALWTSPNGTDWSEQPAAERAIESMPATQVHAILAFGNSIYAAGSVQPGGSQQAALWNTFDGIHWRSVNNTQTSFDGPGEHAIYSLAELGTGVVAVGGVDDGQGWLPASWISPDGISWSPQSTDFPGAPSPTSADQRSFPLGGTVLNAVTSITTTVGPTSVVATGGGPYGQGAWKSDDGIHWTAVPIPPAAASSNSWNPNAVAASSTAVVIVDADPGRPYVLTGVGPKWSQPSSDPTVFGPVTPTAVATSLGESDGRLILQAGVVDPPQAIGPARITTRVLTSVDGANWSPATASQSPPGSPDKGAVMLASGTTWLAVGPGTGSSIEAWTRTGHGPWVASGAVAASTAATPTVLGVCQAAVSPSTGGPSSTGPVAAVGTVASPSPAGNPNGANGANGAAYRREAAAWVTADRSSWHAASVAPAAPVSSVELMAGCAEASAATATGGTPGSVGSATAGELVAYGGAATPAGSPEPAVWRSTNGSAWARFAGSAFTSGSPNPNAYLPRPLVSLATSGDDWIAVAAPTAGVAPPGSAGLGPAPSIEDAAEGLWASTDGGAGWQLLDTAGAPWASDQRTQLSAAAFVGKTAVVVGSADGQLAVWTATPTATVGSSS